MGWRVEWAVEVQLSVWGGGIERRIRWIRESVVAIAQRHNEIRIHIRLQACFCIHLRSTILAS